MTSKRDREHNDKVKDFVPFGHGTGDGSGGSWYGNAHPQSMDYLDVSGRKDKAAKAKTNGTMAETQAAIQNHWGNRPGYQGITDANGNVMNQYQAQAAFAGAPTEGQAYTVNTGELDQRLKGVAQLSTPQSVAAGEAYKNAAGDLNTMRGQAFSTAPSAWAQAAGQQADLQTKQGLTAASQTNAANQAQAYSDLAMTGGAEGGARERLAASGGRDQFNASQNLYQQNQAQKLGITAQDAQMKQQQQMGLTGMGLQFDQYGTGLGRNNVSADQNAQQFNIGNQMQGVGMWQNAATGNAGNQQQASFGNAAAQNNIGLFNAGNQQQANLYNTGQQHLDVAGKNQFGMDTWSQYGQVLGSQATAAAQNASQSKGGFFTKLFGG